MTPLSDTLYTEVCKDYYNEIEEYDSISTWHNPAYLVTTYEEEV